jgi:hypothetical protein
VNVTVPPGFVEPVKGVIVGVTVAVKVTPWFTVDVAGTAASVVVVAVVFTVCATVPELEPKFVSPLYVALIE